MNCITVMEPHASALLFGLQEYEERRFKIKKGKCLIHVSTKCSYSPLKLNEYYRSIGADITADLCLIVFNGYDDTESVRLEKGVVTHKKEFDENSADSKLADLLFRRNASANDGQLFLTSRIIGEIEVTKHEKKEKNCFANYYKPSKVFNLKESIFYKGNLNQFEVKL